MTFTEIQKEGFPQKSKATIQNYFGKLMRANSELQLRALRAKSYEVRWLLCFKNQTNCDGVKPKRGSCKKVGTICTPQEHQIADSGVSDDGSQMVDAEDGEFLPLPSRGITGKGHSSLSELSQGVVDDSQPKEDR
jgi:hypothetical protein